MVNIYFKLVYSFGISINIPTNLKINELNTYIRESVYNSYGINDFYICEGGTRLDEKNKPIDETSNVLFFDKYTDKNVFYIKPKIYCSICLQDNYEYTSLQCRHGFCSVCINNWFSTGNRNCPICRIII
jgi:hypothetical protein